MKKYENMNDYEQKEFSKQIFENKIYLSQFEDKFKVIDLSKCQSCEHDCDCSSEDIEYWENYYKKGLLEIEILKSGNYSFMINSFEFKVSIYEEMEDKKRDILKIHYTIFDASYITFYNFDMYDEVVFYLKDLCIFIQKYLSNKYNIKEREERDLNP